MKYNASGAVSVYLKYDTNRHSDTSMQRSAADPFGGLSSKYTASIKKKNANSVCCPTPIWFRNGVPASIRSETAAYTNPSVVLKNVFRRSTMMPAANRRFSTHQTVFAV